MSPWQQDPLRSKIRGERLIIPNFHIFSYDFYYRLSKVIGVTKYKKLVILLCALLYYYFFFFFFFFWYAEVISIFAVVQRTPNPLNQNRYTRTPCIYIYDGDDAIPLLLPFSQAINHRKRFRRREQNALEPSGQSVHEIAEWYVLQSLRPDFGRPRRCQPISSRRRQCTCIHIYIDFMQFNRVCWHRTQPLYRSTYL